MNDWPAHCASPVVCLDARNCQLAASCPYYGRLSIEVVAFAKRQLLKAVDDTYTRPRKRRRRRT